MTISYKWLSEYLPVTVDPERLSRILTSIGLEVEQMENFEEIKGGLKGLVIGEVLETSAHPNADKLKLTRVNTGGPEPLRIVCGAPNVAPGQKVVVAPVGATIYPVSGDPLTMKLAKIRGEESQGMICAEDEIGMGNSHAGIMVLPPDARPGSRADEYFKPYSDIIYEIGLTPNRMDAMSHWGVARDVCAYLSHHDKKELKPLIPTPIFKPDNTSLSIEVVVKATDACSRYSGVILDGVAVKASPVWLQQKLKSIGLRPINNIVDITNFIQHETGQPLHAFDYDRLRGNRIIVDLAQPGAGFVTLDGKERKLDATDLMINDAEGPVCIAGVFGGAESGVHDGTQRIFLESAWFNPGFVRKTSFRHGLRTDAATRFEKGVDISQTVNVLKRAALLIKEIAGGSIASQITDIYPSQKPKSEVALRYHFLKKLSGKNYHPDAVKNILQGLGFTISREGMDAITVEVPYHKPDVSLPADLVEEIMRIDGLDNIPIPTNISLSPSIEERSSEEAMKEKMAVMLTGMGFTEVLSNSITNSAYFDETQSASLVKLLNNLSSELDVLRPSLLHTGLEMVRFNLNHRNLDLCFYEFGKTYHKTEGGYEEKDRLCLYVTGNIVSAAWNSKKRAVDIYYMKGALQGILAALGIRQTNESKADSPWLSECLEYSTDKGILATVGKVNAGLSDKFDCRQPVYFLDLDWAMAMDLMKRKIRYHEVSKFPSMERDLAMVVPSGLSYGKVQEQILSLKLKHLQGLRLFDVFESEKLGAGKKSLAVNLTFQDAQKTLTDKEIEGWMNKIVQSLEKDLQVEIRK